MSRGRCTFRQSDATKLVKAVVAAGIEVARVEVDKEGKIVVFVGKSGETSEATDLDAWIAKHARAA